MVQKKEVEIAIASLKALDLQTATYEQVRAHTDILVLCGFATATFPKNQLDIYRGRVVHPEKFHNAVSQISYPPIGNPDILKFNRLSTNIQSIFYGVPTSQEIRADQLIAMLEIGSITEDGVTEEYIQIGQWVVNKDFTIAIVGIYSDMANNNPWVQEMKKIQNEMIAALGERGDLVIMAAEFMAQEFSKKVKAGEDWQYKISAAYGDKLFELGLGAILFPSVRAEGKEFNIAMCKELVDEALTIRVSAVSRSRKLSSTEILVDWIAGSPTVADGGFKWQPPPPSAITGDIEFKNMMEKLAPMG